MRLESPRGAHAAAAHISNLIFGPALSLCFDTHSTETFYCARGHIFTRGHPCVFFLRARCLKWRISRIFALTCCKQLSAECFNLGLRSGRVTRNAEKCLTLYTMGRRREAARFRARIPATHAIMHKINREFYCESLLW
jgi:hypothetical protein